MLILKKPFSAVYDMVPHWWYQERETIPPEINMKLANRRHSFSSFRQNRDRERTLPYSQHLERMPVLSKKANDGHYWKLDMPLVTHAPFRSPNSLCTTCIVIESFGWFQTLSNNPNCIAKWRFLFSLTRWSCIYKRFSWHMYNVFFSFPFVA